MKFQVIGADRETGTDIEIIVEARDEVAAEMIANQRNLVVSDVTLVRSGPPKRDLSRPIERRPFLKCAECGNGITSRAAPCPSCGAIESADSRSSVEALGQSMPPPRKPPYGSERGSKSRSIAAAVVFLGLIGVCAWAGILLIDFDAQSSNRSYSPRATEIETFSQHIVTRAEYDQIHHAMSYSEVVSIIGSSGEENSSNRLEGIPGVMDSVFTVMYSWQNRDGSNMNAIFQNDKLVTKAQFGLR